MNKINRKQILTILIIGLVGWALCGAIMFIGMSLMDLQTTLIVHAIGAPIIFSMLSWFYFKKLAYTSPLQTAISFVLIVMIMDFFLVALVINRSLEMFQSMLGTWIPFLLIFISTYLTGMIIQSRSEAVQA